MAGHLSLLGSLIAAILPLANLITSSCQRWCARGLSAAALRSATTKSSVDTFRRPDSRYSERENCSPCSRLASRHVSQTAARPRFIGRDDRARSGLATCRAPTQSSAARHADDNAIRADLGKKLIFPRMTLHYSLVLFPKTAHDCR